MLVKTATPVTPHVVGMPLRFKRSAAVALWLCDAYWRNCSWLHASKHAAWRLPGLCAGNCGCFSSQQPPAATLCLSSYAMQVDTVLLCPPYHQLATVRKHWHGNLMPCRLLQCKTTQCSSAHHLTSLLTVAIYPRSRSDQKGVGIDLTLNDKQRAVLVWMIA